MFGHEAVTIPALQTGSVRHEAELQELCRLVVRKRPTGIESGSPPPGVNPHRFDVASDVLIENYSVWPTHVPHFC